MISCLKITYFAVTTEEISVEELVCVKIEEDGLDLFYFIFIFILFSIYFSIFLFLEQLGLGLIGHAVTSVT